MKQAGSETDPLLSPREPTKSGERTNFCQYLAFAGVGLGPSWAIVNAIYLEVPWFEDTQPEGLALSTWLGLPQAVATMLFMVVVIDGRMMQYIPRLAIPTVILAICVNVVGAIWWRVTLGSSSVILLLVTFGGTIVGNLQFMCLLPWIATNFNPKMTNAFIGGNSLMSALCVLLQLVQSPGQARLFTPTAYWFLLVIPTAIALPAAIYIRANISKNKRMEAGGMTGSELSVQNEPLRSAMEFLFPPFWKRVALHTLLNIYMSAVTWWVLNTILPFAAAATASTPDGIGEDVLQWASALGVIGLLFGTQLSSFVHEDMNFRLPHATVLLTLMLTPVVLACADYPKGGWTSVTGKVVIIVAVFIIRVAFGYMVPLIFRDINRKLGPEISEAAGQFCSFWTQGVSLLVLVGMFLVVYLGGW